MVFSLTPTELESAAAGFANRPELPAMNPRFRMHHPGFPGGPRAFPPGQYPGHPGQQQMARHLGQPYIELRHQVWHIMMAL